MKVSATPTWVGVENFCISQTDSGEAMKAPPPKPMIAMPVAIPGRSFDQGRHRRDVADAEPDAAQHAVAEIDQPELMGIDSHRRQQEADAPTETCREHGAPRAALLHPAAEHGGGEAEEDDG